MKNKKSKHGLFHFVVHYCCLKKRQHKAKKKLLASIECCKTKKELGSVVLFKQFFLDEPVIIQAYNQRLKKLEEQSSQFPHS